MPVIKNKIEVPLSIASQPLPNSEAPGPEKSISESCISKSIYTMKSFEVSSYNPRR